MLRQSKALQVYGLVFDAVWALLIAWWGIVSGHGAAPYLAAIVIVLGLAFSYRLLTTQVCSQPGGVLCVRNLVQTRRLVRTQIELFLVDTGFGGRSTRSIYALLRDGTSCNLEVTQHAVGLSRARVARQQHALDVWLASST